MTSLFYETIKRQAEELLTPILEQEGFELVELQYRRESAGWVLRLFVDTPQGVTINDCASLSGRISDALEVKDIIPNAYTLEVSSPGLDRLLKTEKDFKRVLGKTLDVRAKEEVSGKMRFRGELLACDDKAITLDQGGTIYQIPLDQVAKARVDIEYYQKGALAP